MSISTSARSGRRRAAPGAVLGASLMPAAPPGPHAGAWSAGSDAPERREVKVGFIPLTDCASVVMAAVGKFDEKYGIRIVPSRESSWAAVRDKLVNGDLDAAHVLYGLVYGLQLGIGGPQEDMNVLMALSRNGQAITLSAQLRAQGAVDGPSLARLIRATDRRFVFAQTFPTGTHAMWLYYWLAAHGIDPFKDVSTITVPPSQMAAGMRSGRMDGFCVGEPWNSRAIADNIGFTAATTQDIWADHPEKVLGVTAAFVRRNPNTARAMVAAILEAGRWIDASASNGRATAEIVAQARYIDTGTDLIASRMLGLYDNGLGRSWRDRNHLKFFDGGAVNFPYLSDGMWFMTQHRRWGLLDEDPDYLALAGQVNRTDLYRQAAAAAGVTVPESDLRSSTLIDGAVWDGLDPAAYAHAFAVHA